MLGWRPRARPLPWAGQRHALAGRRPARRLVWKLSSHACWDPSGLVRQAGLRGLMNSQVILLEDGWNRLKTGGVQKIEEILEDMQGGVYKSKISTDEYSQLYTCAG